MGIQPVRTSRVRPTARRFGVGLLALALLLPPLEAQRTERSQARSLRDGTIHVRTLSNGLEVVVVESAAIPFATVEMAFRAGAFTQITQGLHGLPHLLEHMLFQQSERAFAGSVMSRMNEIEASYNASTGDETVTYYFIIPSKHVEKSITVMSDLVRRATFTARDLADEQRIVRGELERRAAEPELLLRTVADRQLWTDAGWARKNPGGNLLSMNDASVQRLQELHRKYYVPNNAALIVTGDVRPDDVFGYAERTFGNWRRGDDPLADLPPLEIPPLTVTSRELVTAPVRDVTVLVRWHGPSVGMERTATYAADVFAGVVNQPLSGTQRRLVETGHFELVSFNYLTNRFVGPIELYAKTTPERAVAAVQALGTELRRLVDPEYFGDEEVVVAKKRQRVFQEMTAESATGVAHTLAGFWGAADMDYYLAYQDSLEARTTAELRQFVSTYLAGKHMSVTVMLSGATQQDIGVRLRTALNGWRVP
ncbi:MAG: pitrilysin family protein [Gemmatimonadaceae bacterium]